MLGEVLGSKHLFSKAILGPSSSHFGFCRGCSVAGSKQVPGIDDIYSYFQTCTIFLILCEVVMTKPAFIDYDSGLYHMYSNNPDKLSEIQSKYIAPEGSRVFKNPCEVCQEKMF